MSACLSLDSDIEYIFCVCRCILLYENIGEIERASLRGRRRHRRRQRRRRFRRTRRQTTPLRQLFR